MKMITKIETREQEQKTIQKDEKHEELSIDSGVPDLENEAKDSDNSEKSRNRR